MVRYANFRFFGGGGDTETTEVRKRDPEDPKLTALRNQISDSLNGVFNGSNYATDYNNTKNRANTALGYYDQAATGLNSATSRMSNAADALNNVATTGVIPQAITDNLNAAVNRSMNQSFGTTLNDLASKGIINSSVTNRSINNMEDSAANAYNQNYLTAYNNVVNNMNTALGGYGSLVNGYNTVMNSFAGIPKTLYSGLSAAYQDPYTFWKDWQNSYDQREDYDTVVTHSGK